jgi:enoyl-CoA hydratase
MPYNHILFETGSDGIAVLTANRPAKLNALNTELLGEVDDAVSRVESEPSIRGLIITGAGEKSFIAGADIQELATVDPIGAEETSRRGQRIFRRLEKLSKPSIAAVNGYALGGGLELAMSCTLRVASPNAKLGQPEVKLGIIPGYGGTQRLPRLIGRGLALELLLTGEPIDAAEAHRIGLVNHVVPQSELLDFCHNLLAKILANGPHAVRLTMEAVDAGLNMGLEDGMRYESAAFALSASTADKQEGTRAFLEKRKPAFSGR